MRLGFNYTYTNEQIREYMKVPLDMKLRWLKKANALCSKLLKGRRKKVWEMMREGREIKY